MKMIKKIIFLFSITYCFILQSSSKEENTNNWYRTLLSKRYLGLPVSAIIGGSLAAGLKYVFDNNKFLSSFKVAEKIKHPPYVKFVGAGMIAGVGLYELLKLLTKPKKEENFNRLIILVSFCPGSLYSLLFSQDGLKSHTAREIENKISRGSIEKYSENQFVFLGTKANPIGQIDICLQNPDYAAALYLINEDQKESFEEKLFEDKLTEGYSVYDLYKMKPTTKENLLCYALPLKYFIDDKNKKTYSPYISSEIKPENIDQYSFQLTKEDAKNINLNAREIDELEFILRTNNQDKSDNS
jgi:hypothetical protein